MSVTHKTGAITIDGTPVKRMFWSIISDYDLKTGICELIDNAIDMWMAGGHKKRLEIHIELDTDRQLISVHDNAGGIKQDELQLLVTPGGSKNDPNAEVIGIFGVGGKRGSIALGEHVEVKTRSHRDESYQLDITREWLETEDWKLEAYRIPDIPSGTTQVEVSHLRKPLTEENVVEVIAHLGETYGWFLHKDCTINVNGKGVRSKDFDKWAYPSGFPPRTADFSMTFGNEPAVKVKITAGLIWDRDPERENYGVYVYCNHRLVVKELKTREVGYFVSSEAGVPHPDASLCRAIVQLQGPARLMPWTSNKSGFNAGEPVFQQLRPILIRLVSHFSSLSRRLKNEWDKKVFSYKRGTNEPVEVEDLSGKRLNLPPLPRVNRLRAERLKTRNKIQIKNQPWTLGLVEAMSAVDIIERQRLETKNRIALIVLDSNFEIALKEFIVHRDDLFPSRQFPNSRIQDLFQRRQRVIDTITAAMPIPQILLDKAKHYYETRNKLIHERATVDITDSDIENYKLTIQEILTLLFGLKFSSAQ